MTDAAVAILNRHIAEALAARDFHRQAGRRGNIEAMLAGHKIAWLKDLLREIQSIPRAGGSSADHLGNPP